MNKFELAERLVELLDGQWTSEKLEVIGHIRAKLEDEDGSIEISVGKRKFTLNLREIV